MRFKTFGNFFCAHQLLQNLFFSFLKAHDQQQRQRSVLQLPINTLTIPKITTNVCVDDDTPEEEEGEKEEEFHALDYLEEGKFFGKEELDAEGERALSRSTSPLPLDISGGFF